MKETPKESKEERMIKEINYILRRNYNTSFLRSAMTRLLILEQMKKK